MSSSRFDILKLPTPQIVERLNPTNQNPHVIEETLAVLTTITPSEQNDIDERGFMSLGDVLNQVILLQPEQEVLPILTTLLDAYPAWYDDFYFPQDYPLHLALQEGKLDLFYLLLERGADEVSPNGQKLIEAALECTLYQRSEEVMTVCLETGLFSPRDLNRALAQACEDANVGVVRSLVQHGATLEWENDDGETALSHACLLDERLGALEIVEILFEAEGFVGALNKGWQGQKSSAPLYNAARAGNVPLMDFLISKGAFIDGVDKLQLKGFSPLMAASGAWEKDAISCLLKNGADVGMRDTGGRNALHWLVDTRTTLNNDEDFQLAKECCDLLLEGGVSLDDIDVNGLNPIDWAQNHDKILLASYMLGKRIHKDLSPIVDHKDKQVALKPAPFRKM